jgi:hypothetical protein
MPGNMEGTNGETAIHGQIPPGHTTNTPSRHGQYHIGYQLVASGLSGKGIRMGVEAAQYP